MSALYLGTGEREKRLVRAIRQNLTENHPELKVKVLLDYCRGTRVVNGESSCTVLGRLLADKKVPPRSFRTEPNSEGASVNESHSGPCGRELDFVDIKL